MKLVHTEIQSQVLKWPPTERIRLAERLLESVDNFATENIDRAWRSEIARRVGETVSGREPGISSRQVFAKARKTLVGRSK